MRGTWETTDSGGSGLGTVVLIIIAAAVLGPAVAAAVAELLHLLVIVIAALAAVAGAGLVAAGAWRLRSGRQDTARVLYQVTPAPPRASPLPSEPRPAIEAPREVHLHLYGVSAEEVAAAIRNRDNPR